VNFEICAVEVNALRRGDDLPRSMKASSFGKIHLFISRRALGVDALVVEWCARRVWERKQPQLGQIDSAPARNHLSAWKALCSYPLPKTKIKQDQLLKCHEYA